MRSYAPPDSATIRGTARYPVVDSTSSFDARRAMNWDQVRGNWMLFKGRVKETWGDLTNDDLDVIQGRRDQLVGRIQERYGVAKEEAERQIAAWERGVFR
jgi:uncharacterized protein YjbJ (UPF0337 family)